MDRHVLWLRRFVISRVGVRLLVEGSIVGIATFWGVLSADVEIALAVVLALLAAQVFAVARLVTSVLGNPINHRYLMRWEDTSVLLQPREIDGGVTGDTEQTNSEFTALVEESGFAHLVRLNRPGTDDAFEVYSSTAKLVLVGAGASGGPFVILSRVSDGRLLVTTRELVPPHSKTIVNQNRRGSFADLVESHVEMLGILRRNGLHVVEAGYEAVTDQLHLEWEAWNQLGPFVGPFVAVGRRPRPLLLQARVPELTMWDRTSVTVPQLEGASDSSESETSVPSAPSEDEFAETQSKLTLVDAA